MDDRSRLIDLSHVVEHGLVTYRGLPAPSIGTHLSREQSARHYAPGTTFHIGRIDMVANTGTYLDAPYHRYADGWDLADLPLESLADLDGLRIEADSETRAIEDWEARPVRGRAVLFHTGWDRHWGSDRYFEGHPFLTEGCARKLADEGAALVGIDSLNIDDTADLRRPAHSILLAANIPIVEHLCGLDRVPQSGFRFFAVPVKVRAFGTFPVRAFAITSPSSASS
ncbi:MAG: cyclase family protein [Candidatus Eisenbacteria bacterium]